MHIVVGDRSTVALFKLMGFEGKTIEDPLGGVGVPQEKP
jgi:V/A-type H+-transporting ATPase subunit F